MKQVSQSPLRVMVYAFHIVVVDHRIPASQRRSALRQPAHHPGTLRLGCTRCNRPVGEPPELGESQSNSDNTIDQEHPLESDVALRAIHLLETSRYETDNRRRDLCSRKVLANALSNARRRVEEREIVGHARP